MREYMWDKKDSMFYPLNGMEQIREKTCETFLPLFAGILTKREAKRLVKKHLLNEDEFWTPYPIPTASVDSAKFSPNKYWRGSTWVNINWFIIKGLKDYGFDDIANELKKRTIRLVKEKGFHEFFNPFTGRGVGVNDFAWSGLIIDL
jgi:glycogen debranching enzyme